MDRNQLWQRDRAREGWLVRTMVKSFSAKGKLSQLVEPGVSTRVPGYAPQPVFLQPDVSSLSCRRFWEMK
jgi:hypothetical protein